MTALAITQLQGLLPVCTCKSEAIKATEKSQETGNANADLVVLARYVKTMPDLARGLRQVLNPKKSSR